MPSSCRCAMLLRHSSKPSDIKDCRAEDAKRAAKEAAQAAKKAARKAAADARQAARQAAKACAATADAEPVPGVSGLSLLSVRGGICALLAAATCSVSCLSLWAVLLCLMPVPNACSLGQSALQAATWRQTASWPSRGRRRGSGPLYMSATQASSAC